MRSLLLIIGLLGLAAAPHAVAQSESKTIIGGGNADLNAGADHIRGGDFDEGIRLTIRGLGQYPKPRDRAAALSNLCAAYAAANQLDTAIEHCDQALEINRKNWRTYNNRAAAFLLKDMYYEAVLDIDAGLAINPNSKTLGILKDRVAELRARPRVIMEDYPTTRRP